MIDNHLGADYLLGNQEAFIEQLRNWWANNNTDLPWRRNKDPYGIWVAEVMLQQTQIATVIPYYEKWMSRFPTVVDLAQASLDEVLKMWQGLGYYSRARNLHTTGRIILNQYDGQLPEEVSELMKLPGIGRYTAGAVASIAFGRPDPVLDGNVIRVISRLIDLHLDITLNSTRNELWHLASILVPEEKPGDFNQALMELGQRICLPANPNCPECPVSVFCLAYKHGTQYERPVRPPRKRIPHYDVVAGIIWQAQPSPDGKFLITRRPYDSMLGGLWEFPGGKVEDTEENADALRREIAEELAIDIQVGKFICEVKHAYTHFRITLHAYYAKYLSGTPRHIGVSDHAWVSLSDIERYPFAVTDLRIIEALQNEFA